MKEINPDDFKILIEKNQELFKKLEKLYFRTLDFNDSKFQEIMKKIYSRFRKIKGIEQTGATKLMALELPHLFVMWDTKIRKAFNIPNEGTAEQYLEFLKVLQLQFSHIKWEGKTKPFAKAVDEYNFYTVHIISSHE